MIFILLLIVVDAYLSGLLLLPVLSNHPILFWCTFGMLQLAFGLMSWLFFVFFKSTADHVIPFEKPLRNSAFLAMGAISFLFSFTAFRDLIALILIPFGQAWQCYSENVSITILMLSLLCFIIGALNAQMRLHTPRVEVLIQTLPPALSGLTIAQLSDIHLGTGPNPKQVAKLVDRTLAMNPDLIVLTGDIIDGNTDEITAELSEIARLKAPHGVYFVLGNHECYWKHQDSIDAMKKMGIHVLENMGVEKIIDEHTIFIAGMNDPAITHFNGEGPKVPTIPTHSILNLILVHQPQFSKLIAEHDYHLQLSGHTHGGQFFPWNLAVKRMYQFDKGLGKLKNLWVYVNMGSGYWGPPIRLGSQCEITELVLVSS
jgi:predicted MPP superfamily phosphohydrolase